MGVPAERPRLPARCDRAASPLLFRRERRRDQVAFASCGGERRSLAPLGGPVIGPQQARRDAAPGAPGLGEHDRLLRRRPFRQREGEPRRLLQRKVAGRPGVGMAEAEQEVDVGRPRADAMDGAQRRVGRIRRQVGQRFAIELAARDRLRDLLERANFRRREAERSEPRGAGANEPLGGEGIVGRQPAGPRSRRRSRSRAVATPRCWRGRRSRPARRRSGSGPASAATATRRGSAPSSAANPVAISASVSMRVMVGRLRDR